MKESIYKSTVILIVIFCAGAAVPCAGDIIYVDADSPGAGDGTNWTNAYNYLRDALIAAVPGDTIRVAKGIYKPDADNANPGGSGNRESAFNLKNEVTILGGYPGYGEPDPNARNHMMYESVLSGDLNGDDGADFINYEENSYQVVRANDTNSTAILDGFTITGGNANGSSNYYYNGGGLFSFYGSATVVNCNFCENKADYEGGGIWMYKSSPSFINCRFIGNKCPGDEGGALVTRLSDPNIINCLFIGNHANRGGVLYNVQSSPTFTNCTFFSNTAYICGGLDSFSHTMTNCILWGNSDTHGGTSTEQEQIRGGSASGINYCCIQGWTGSFGGTGNIGDDPLFFDAPGMDGIPGTEDDDLHLLFDSPCINEGDNSAVPPSIVTDLDGGPRIVNGTVDMGVYEVNGTGPVIRISPKTFEFFTYETAEKPPDQMLAIWNRGVGTLDWQITYDCNWLAVEPNSGSSTGEVNEVTLSVDKIGLEPGIYDCNLLISDPCAVNSPKIIAVVFHIARTITVDDDGPADFNNIQAAINYAVNRDEVVVNTGRYTGPGNRDISFLGKAVNLHSTNPDDPCIVAATIIDCNARRTDQHRAFYLQNDEGPDTVINGFTITKGFSPYDVWYEYDWVPVGGGICCYFTSPTIKNCRIIDNRAVWHGSGIFGVNCNSSIIGCTIADNYSERGHGGGIYIDNGDPVINGCIVYGNDFYGWGSIYFESTCDPQITNCIIRNNISYQNKAGIYGTGNCHLKVSNCTIVDNDRAVWGGAVDCANSSSANVTNCICRGNHHVSTGT